MQVKNFPIRKQPTATATVDNNMNKASDIVEKITNNNVFQHHTYCINCIGEDHQCSECKEIKSIYCIIERNDDMLEMKILNKQSNSNKTTAATVQITK